MTDAELAVIKARCDAATPGPWRSLVGRDFDSGSSFIDTPLAPQRGHGMEISGATREDRDFIAAAREDVPVLLAEVARLRAILREHGIHM